MLPGGPGGGACCGCGKPYFACPAIYHRWDRVTNPLSCKDDERNSYFFELNEVARGAGREKETRRSGLSPAIL